jgi:hypothetical protein
VPPLIVIIVLLFLIGWRKAVLIARKALEDSAIDHGSDPDLFRTDLINIAKTTLSSKLLNTEKYIIGPKQSVDELVSRLEPREEVDEKDINDLLQQITEETDKQTGEGKVDKDTLNKVVSKIHSCLGLAIP